MKYYKNYFRSLIIITNERKIKALNIKDKKPYKLQKKIRYILENSLPPNTEIICLIPENIENDSKILLLRIIKWKNINNIYINLKKNIIENRDIFKINKEDILHYKFKKPFLVFYTSDHQVCFLKKNKLYGIQIYIIENFKNIRQNNILVNNITWYIVDLNSKQIVLDASTLDCKIYKHELLENNLFNNKYNTSTVNFIIDYIGEISTKIIFKKFNKYVRS